jgi:hypothetical protein
MTSYSACQTPAVKAGYYRSSPHVKHGAKRMGVDSTVPPIFTTVSVFLKRVFQNTKPLKNGHFRTCIEYKCGGFERTLVAFIDINCKTSPVISSGL